MQYGDLFDIWRLRHLPERHRREASHIKYVLLHEVLILSQLECLELQLLPKLETPLCVSLQNYSYCWKFFNT